MAYNFSQRARRVAWSSSESDKDSDGIGKVRRVGTDSTFGDGDSVTLSTSIKRFSSDEPIASFVSALKKDGCVIIEDFTSLDVLQAATRETKDWLRDETGTKTLIQQSLAVREKFVADRVYQQLCEEFLKTDIKKWRGEDSVVEVCQPVLSSVRARRVPDTSSDDALSRYDAALGTRHSQDEKYRCGRDSMLGLLVPNSQTLEVHTILGSHLLSSKPSDLTGDIIQEELKASEAFIVLGSLYHHVAVQAESQMKMDPAFVHTIWSCAGVYRPEDDLASLITVAEMNGYPKVIQERLK